MRTCNTDFPCETRTSFSRRRSSSIYFHYLENERFYNFLLFSDWSNSIYFNNYSYISSIFVTFDSNRAIGIFVRDYVECYKLCYTQLCVIYTPILLQFYVFTGRKKKHLNNIYPRNNFFDNKNILCFHICYRQC